MTRCNCLLSGPKGDAGPPGPPVSLFTFRGPHILPIVVSYGTSGASRSQRLACRYSTPWVVSVPPPLNVVRVFQGPSGFPRRRSSSSPSPLPANVRVPPSCCRLFLSAGPQAQSPAPCLRDALLARRQRHPAPGTARPTGSAGSCCVVSSVCRFKTHFQIVLSRSDHFVLGTEGRTRLPRLPGVFFSFLFLLPHRSVPPYSYALSPSTFRAP